jgi:antitoxin component YwqK of YwqJK toxin-antitoxin module
MEWANVGYSGGSDAAGNGMAHGILHLSYIALQIINALFVFFAFVTRQFSGNLLLRLAIIAAIFSLLYFFLLTDYRRTFLLLIPATEESKLIEKGGMMFTTKNEAFTGTSIIKGWFDTYPTTHRENKQEGIRLTHYKNGLKDGEERLYYTINFSFFNLYRTELHCTTQYRNGRKNGTEVINYTGGDRNIEAQYVDGKLNGLYKEFYYNYRDRSTKNQLKIETAYKNDKISGFYRSYSEYGEDKENYTCMDDKIIDGRIMHDLDTAVQWRWYTAGQLLRERVFEYGYASSALEGEDGRDLISETLYDNGQIIELRMFNTDNNRVNLYKKRINGELIEIFNRDADIDRRKEFGEN